MKKATRRKQKHGSHSNKLDRLAQTINQAATPAMDVLPETRVHIPLPTTGGSILYRLQQWFVFLTIKQWEAIDAEYRRPDPKAEVKGILTMVLVAIMLTLRKYFGSKRFFRNNLGELVRDWPFPQIWGHIYWSPLRSDSNKSSPPIRRLRLPIRLQTIGLLHIMLLLF